jgi:hypothetical protein
MQQVSSKHFHAINIQEKSEVVAVVKMTTLLWLRLHVDSKVDNASKKHTVSTFRAEDGSIPNETKGMGTV